MTNASTTPKLGIMKGPVEPIGGPSLSGNSGCLRVMLAYIIGVNAFGLVYALTFLVGSFFHMANVVAFLGLIVGLGVGVAAGVRTDRALKRWFT